MKLLVFVLKNLCGNLILLICLSSIKTSYPAQIRLTKNNVKIPNTKKYNIILTLSFVRYDKSEHRKKIGNNKNESFLPISILASNVLSEYKKLMAYISQKAINMKYTNLLLYWALFTLNPSSKTPLNIVVIKMAIMIYVAILQEKGMTKAYEINKMYSLS
jgi:hypothetical protein